MYIANKVDSAMQKLTQLIDTAEAFASAIRNN
jgi:conjugal transfer/entry exclusion protein